MSRILCTKTFLRWWNKQNIDDAALVHALEEMESGLNDASLGHNMFKQRIPLPGKGKRAGARTIVVYKKDNNCFFVYGYNKKDRSNITKQEFEALRSLAEILLSLSSEEIEAYKNHKILKEVKQ